MKRALDFLAGLIGIILLSPVMIIVSLIILITDGRPVLFKQQRVGKGNKLFTVYKYRTMRNGTGDIATEELKDADEKITKVGRFLRVYSTDELPQLFNILNGTMSLVGPRPLIPAEENIRRLREEYNVYSVTPGITGLAQINGRDNLSIEEKALLDKEYIENQSLLLDIKIILKTFKKVIHHDDVREGSDTD
ncbi:MAG: sugar transferase [Clostridia bacterium]|nr:sugar transferase [Clostridia bacterium]